MSLLQDIGADLLPLFRAADEQGIVTQVVNASRNPRRHLKEHFLAVGLEAGVNTGSYYLEPVVDVLNRFGLV